MRPIAPASSTRASRARAAFGVVAWIYLAAIFVQVFLAGLGVFVGPSQFETHKLFAATFILYGTALVAFAYIGSVDRVSKREAWALAALLVLQGGWVHLAQLVNPVFGAMHPVNALLMAGVAYRTAMDARVYFARRSPAGTGPAAHAASAPMPGGTTAPVQGGLSGALAG